MEGKGIQASLTQNSYMRVKFANNARLLELIVARMKNSEDIFVNNVNILMKTKL